MSLWRMVLKSLRQHGLSTSFAIVNIGLGVALLLAVLSLREQAHANFTQTGVGVDAILGPKGSPLQVVLNGVYHLDEMPGTIKWKFYEKVASHPIVEQAIPFCTGHSYAGYRVNAIDSRFLTEFEYLPGKKFSFDPKDGGQGRAFVTGRKEAVAGWAVAKALNLKLGQTFNPVCGVRAGDPVHVNDDIEFVGILAPTGTPHDRAIYIPLTTFYTLEGHDRVAGMAVNEANREISGAYLKIKRVRGGAVHLGLQTLKFDINSCTQPDELAQLVVPNEVLPRLFEIIGWVDGAFLAIAVLVTALGTMCLLVALVSALRERRRDIALMRTMGASRRTVFGLVLLESMFIALAGGLLGVVLGHGIVYQASGYIKAETGLGFSWLYASTADLALLPALVLIGFVAGLFPAGQAYRLGVLKNLRPVS